MTTSTPPSGFFGSVERRAFASAVLSGNRAGDPHVREVAVYLPPQASSAGARFPVVFLLCGYSGDGRDFFETHPWRRGAVARYDELVARGEAEPAIVVAPNAFTRLGGSQYVNSEFLGAYEDYVALELPDWIDAHYPTLHGRRALLGKSSGGFGAMRLSMRHPERFPVAGSISGDVDFEACYASAFPACLRGLVPYGLDPARFLEEFARAPDLTGDKHEVINVLAMAACYSPNVESALGFELPFELRTAARVEPVWRKWLEFDPLHACERYADNWRKLELLHLECGLRDEYHLQWGLRKLSDKLRSLGVPHEHEEHPGAHRGLVERYVALLPRVATQLAR
jgi:S-formylglutathione hydrolase FrmB